MIAKNLTELIGNTPMLELNRYSNHYGLSSKIIAKLEFFNPCSSIKDRAAFNMIIDAEKKGLLKNGATIIEPTSGNTGLGLAWIAAARGYKMVLTMPASMSIERRKLAAQFGAKVVLTPANEGMSGAIRVANELHNKTENSYIPQQFSNPANADAHRKTTAQEILRDTNGEIDIFAACVGTGGTLTGIGEVLREKIPNIKIYAIEPSSSPLLSEGKAGAHGIQGIGANFIPEILNTKIYDGVVTIDDADAIASAKDAALLEGLLVGISSGAAIAAAKKLARVKENYNKKIVIVLPDTGERYISTALFD